MNRTTVTVLRGILIIRIDNGYGLVIYMQINCLHFFQSIFMNSSHDVWYSFKNNVDTYNYAIKTL